jgi:hypothetical protein
VTLHRVVGICLATLVLVIPHEASGQGRGRPKRPQATVQAAEGSTTASPAAGFRQFGTWLDDASGTTPGEARTGFGIGYWRTAGGSQMDVPMVDLGYGLTRRVQVGATVPFYRASYGGTTARGLDDMYLSAKFTALDPSTGDRSFGLAVTPVVEVLGADSGDSGRTHWALPVSIEFRGDPVRVYGSTGYFSRGAVFGGAAVEWSASNGVAVTGALTQSYSIKEDLVSDSLGVSRQRADVVAGVAYPVAQTVAAYVTIGRSLTSLAAGGTSFAMSGGIVFRFSPSRATP